MQAQFLMLLSYTLLYLTVVSLWLPKKSGFQIWQILLTVSITLALLSGLISPIALIPIILLPITIHYWQLNTSHIMRIFLFIFIMVLCIGLAAHLFPGFHNLKIIDQVYVSKNAISFSMYLNVDKALVGIFILGMTHRLISNKKDWVLLLKNTLPFMTFFIIVMMTLALLLRFVRFDPKLPTSLFIWIITNLLFVSTAEEAFFRGFLQKTLTQKFKKISYGNYVAILCAAILFGLAHYMAGNKYILLATLAGIGYGVLYDRTKHIESSIITHFSINLTHFLFFTYPMLASAV